MGKENQEEQKACDNEVQKAFTEGFEALKLIQSMIDKKNKITLTLVCKNEDAIIEQNIRFHKAMGVDNIIVLDHNSTDNTPKILNKLKEEGIVDEIIIKTDAAHKHSLWVNEMIDIAREKYDAAWVINADADEFYFSKSLNLKKSILAANGANIIKCYMNDIYPDDREDFLSCPYFITRPFYQFESGMLDSENGDEIIKEFSFTKTPKVIHSTQGIKKLYHGNHSVEMEDGKEIESADIILYHFNIRNYNQLEARIARWLEAIKYMPGQMGYHMKEQIEIYKAGKLKEFYDAKFNPQKRELLIKNGVVSIDTSLYHFLKHNKII